MAVQYGIARLVPTVADPRLASSLGVESGTLLMLIDQVDYDVDGRAVLFSVEHHLAGAFELTVLRSGTGLAPAEGARLGLADETASPNGS
jgi:DNA-binding GntR family transcriptional regulator